MGNIHVGFVFLLSVLVAAYVELSEAAQSPVACTLFCMKGYHCVVSSDNNCGSSICQPKPTCVPLETTESAPSTVSWEDPCNLVDCQEGYTCETFYHTCDRGTCPPTAECVLLPSEDATNNSEATTAPDPFDQQCPLGSDYNTVCDATCPDTYECRCRTLPTVRCDGTTSCFFPTCVATGKTKQCTEASDVDKVCHKKCPQSLECRCKSEPRVRCEGDKCLFPTCVEKESSNHQQCKNFSVAGKLCIKDYCNASEECRCIKPDGIICIVGPCLFPVCVEKRDTRPVKENEICDTRPCEEGYYCKKYTKYCFTTPCFQPPPRCVAIPQTEKTQSPQTSTQNIL